MTPALHTRRSHFLPALTMLGVGVLALAGCSAQSPPQATVTVTSTPTQVPVSESPTPSAPAPNTPTASSSPDTGTTTASARYAALAAAAKTAQNLSAGTVTSIESKDAGTWEVSVFTKQDTEHEVHISADGSTVISGPSEQRLSSSALQRYRSLVDSAKIDVIAAAQVVEKESPQGLIEELDIDSWRGTTTWEAEVKEGSQSREIYLDAMTGAVLKNELD